MPNGIHSASSVQPAPPPDDYTDEHPHVIKINFGLTWKHIAAVALGAPAFFASLMGTGWLVLPAKQSDLKHLEQQVTGISQQVHDLQNVSLRLTTAVDELTASVKRFTDRPAAVAIPKRRTR